MLIKTKFHGEKEIDEQKIITFVEGLPGFENRHKFVLLEHKPGGPVFWLQSLEDEKLAFAVISPCDFYADYKPELESNDMQFLELTSMEDALVLAILVVPPDPAQITVNLQAPLVINRRNNLGRQVILQNSLYKTRHYLFNQQVEAGYQEKLLAEAK
mgnify:CR=1 FL=1